MNLIVIWACLIALSLAYTPDWKSLDSRPLPSWYDADKFGIFVHWGVFSVPAYWSEWIWYYWREQKDPNVIKFMEKNFPGLSYADLGAKFTAADFDAATFASIIKSSGAKYFVVTSKHHEGYTLWPSTTSFNWNSVDLGSHRDLIGELRTAIRKEDIHFGVYFSQLAWFHPLYLKDKVDGTRNYPDNVSLVQMRELINTYKPDVLWSDGDWERGDFYWSSKEFLAWLFTDSPVNDTIVVNDRWGIGVPKNHGSFISGPDKFMPGHLIKKKWESCTTLDKNSWGYRRNMRSSDVLTTKEVITLLTQVLAWGGNLLLNIGPDHLGNIPPIFEDRLRDIGKFVKINSEAIFETKPWIYQNDSESIWYTSKTNDLITGNDYFNPQIEGVTVVYAFLLDWDDTVQLKSIKPSDNIKVTLLGTSISLKTTTKSGVFTVVLPSDKKFPHPDAIVLKIENAKTDKFLPMVYDP